MHVIYTLKLSTTFARMHMYILYNTAIKNVVVVTDRAVRLSVGH